MWAFSFQTKAVQRPAAGLGDVHFPARNLQWQGSQMCRLHWALTRCSDLDPLTAASAGDTGAAGATVGLMADTARGKTRVRLAEPWVEAHGSLTEEHAPGLASAACPGTRGTGGILVGIGPPAGAAGGGDGGGAAAAVASALGAAGWGVSAGLAAPAASKQTNTH